MSQSSEQMRQMEEMIQGLRQQVDTLDRKPAGANVVPSLAQPPAVPPAELPPPPAPPLPEMRVPALPPLPPPPANAGLGTPPEAVPAMPRIPGIASFEVSDAKPGAPLAGKGAEKKDVRSYVPSGSFFRAALLGGLDAPTGGQAQSNPHPVLMRVQDNAFLPNRYRFRIRECFALGASYGDISAERAYIRLESLSCVRHDGRAIDAPVKGYVVGEDGKAGMRGRLVSKQGQVLANALLAGIGAGIGQAFQQSATTVSTSPLGSVGTVEPGQTAPGRPGDRVSARLSTDSRSTTSRSPRRCSRSSRSMPAAPSKWCSPRASRSTASPSSDGDSYTDIWRRGPRSPEETPRTLPGVIHVVQNPNGCVEPASL
jgi:conjugal transfer pilus assembly protein TraB